MYHDTGTKFLSPTINLNIEPKDFIKFIENLEYYLSIDQFEEVIGDYDYPVGKLDDILIYFVHYDNFKEAVYKWNERKKRINFDNLFIIMADRDGCDINIIERFNKTSYKNKIFFTHKKYEEYDNCIYINYKDPYADQIGLVTNMGSILGKRVYECGFNYIKWLNKDYDKVEELCKN